ncbi:DUF418 domain-containing protein [Metabacillus sp. RGM 3146]|uniref:DUF418 domain-containing protein n=1 Tax=Metabacillus sp. RGM 3146 TaxID=3401092 RepID=UPI003B9B1F13
MEKFTPVEKAERLYSLDILRGFALFGIVLVNIFDFSRPLLYQKSMVESNDFTDRTIEIMVSIFAQASFYPLFSLLFGAGTWLFYERLRQRDQSFSKFYGKRLAALFLFGVIHAFFIWHGDILMTYAVTGFIFMPLIKMSRAFLLQCGICLLFIPNILLGLLYAIAGAERPQNLILAGRQEQIQHSLQTYSQGSWVAIFGRRLADWYYTNNLYNAPLLILSLLPLFMLGAYAAKRGWFQNKLEPDVRKELKLLFFLSWAIGLPLKICPYVTGENVLTRHLQLSIGGPVLAFFYASGILLLLQRRMNEKAYKPLLEMGRASLSNYLIQSVVLCFVFYSYGLRLYGEASSARSIAIAIVVYVGQAFLSVLWFRRFSYGPAEKVWRKMIYGA